MSVFVDTSGLFAVADANEPNHPAARAVWGQMLDDGAQLYTTNLKSCCRLLPCCGSTQSATT